MFCIKVFFFLLFSNSPAEFLTLGTDGGNTNMTRHSPALLFYYSAQKSPKYVVYSSKKNKKLNKCMAASLNSMVQDPSLEKICAR